MQKQHWFPIPVFFYSSKGKWEKLKFNTETYPLVIDSFVFPLYLPNIFRNRLQVEISLDKTIQ